jgi:hypothetical protein
MSAPATFEEFWPYYVAQHLDPVNRWLHVLGSSLALGALALGPIFPPAILLAPLLGYGAAWLGHFRFEQNRPASFGHPLWSLRGDARMWWRTLTGRLAPDLARGRAAAAVGARA